MLKKKSWDAGIESRWDRTAPRYSEILNSNEFYLPSDNWMINEFKKKDKIDVFFFLDISGSCYHLKNRFFKAARSLDPKRFKIHLYSFDTRVHELDIKSNQIYGGGGTAFHIIENCIQEYMRANKKKYPHSVWIITDGYGNNVTPEIPNRWHWFLTSDHYGGYVHKDSHKHLLKDYD
jgi:hypothetical protein